VNEFAQTLDSIETYLRRYVVMSDEQAGVMSLWNAHTHAFDASDYTPYIFVTSAERESGKSRLKEACELLVANPVPTSNVSPAALFRIAGESPLPTFLVDEADEIFTPKSERCELRGLLNAGFHRGDFAIRMVGEGTKQSPHRFSVYCPKMLIGKSSANLGDTLESRCIRIELKRKTREEKVDRFRRREVEEEAGYLAESLRSLGEYYVDRLTYARPYLPGEISDRQQDIFEPLLALAELAGDGWPERARAAAVVRSTGDESDESLGVRLLSDCYEIFNGYERLSTARLLELLCLIEEAPWVEKWWDPYKGEPKSGAFANLAWHLRRYGIRSKTIRFEEGLAKGYERERFEDSWSRYILLPIDLSRNSCNNPHETGDCAPSVSRNTTSLVTAYEGGSNPHEYGDVTDVTAQTPLEQGAEDQIDLEPGWLMRALEAES
jgi:Protein of unknown function (DUF3631)